MTTTKTLPESFNDIHIEGLVSDLRIEEKLIKGKNAITGEIDIQVTPESIQTINLFSYEMTKDNNVSKLYKTIVTIRDEYKTIKTHGIENADKVRIEKPKKFDNGKVGENGYAGQDEKWKSYPKLSAKFVNRLTASDVFEPQAKFTLQIAVASTKEEMRNGEETGRLILKGYVVGYQDGSDDTKKIFPVELIVANPTSVDYVRDTYEKGNTVEVYGNIVNQTIVTKKVTEVGFGEPQEHTDRNEVTEYVVVGGTPPLDEDDKNAFDATLIREAIKKRDAAIEKKIEEKKKKGNSPQPINSGFGKKNDDPFSDNNVGFGENPKSKKVNSDPFSDDGKPIDISDDDLPF